MKKNLIICLVFLFSSFSLMADGHDGDEEGSGSMVNYHSYGLAFNASGGGFASGGGYTLHSSYAFGENSYLYLDSNNLDGDTNAGVPFETDYRTIGLGYVFLRDNWLFRDSEEMKKAGHRYIASIRVALLMEDYYWRFPQSNSAWYHAEGGASIGVHDIAQDPNGNQLVTGFDSVDYEGTGVLQGVSFSGTRYYLGYFMPLGDDAQNKIGFMYTKNADETAGDDQTFLSLVWKMQR